MLEKIKNALQNNPDIKDWIIRQDLISGTQQYELKDRTESIREINSELYTVDVLCDSVDSEGKPSSGLGTVSILPEGEIEPALQKAVLTAQLVHNPPYEFTEPAPIPTVELADPAYQQDPVGQIQGVLKNLKEITDANPQVRLTAAECFGQEKKTRLVSSRGVDAEQTATNIYLQWVYIGGQGEHEVETFTEISRRRVKDLNLSQEAALRSQYTADLLEAGSSQAYQGPVYVQGSTLAVMISGESLSGSVIEMLSSASLKYTGETPWKIGKSIFRQEVKGDDLTLWANRQLPYGVPSSAFDKEGIPAQRIALIKQNKLASFIADQRFAYYLDLKPSGAFGSVEMPAGSKSMADLQKGDHLEIAEFSWFNPNPISGDFACEIRLGYLVQNGKKIPFRGGMLVGNLLDALADVRWSKETGFYGNYLGPRAALFNSLKVTG